GVQRRDRARLHVGRHGLAIENQVRGERSQAYAVRLAGGSQLRRSLEVLAVAARALAFRLVHAHVTGRIDQCPGTQRTQRVLDLARTADVEFLARADVVGQAALLADLDERPPEVAACAGNQHRPTADLQGARRHRRWRAVL